MLHHTPQKLMPFPASQEFINELHAGLEATCYSNRSQFIRDAIVEKFHRMGIKFPPELATPPRRGLIAAMLAGAAKAARNGGSTKARPGANGLLKTKVGKPATRKSKKVQSRPTRGSSR